MRAETTPGRCHVYYDDSCVRGTPRPTLLCGCGGRSRVADSLGSPLQIVRRWLPEREHNHRCRLCYHMLALCCPLAPGCCPVWYGLDPQAPSVEWWAVVASAVLARARAVVGPRYLRPPGPPSFGQPPSPPPVVAVARMAVGFAMVVAVKDVAVVDGEQRCH
jgi:hypothetical protein